MGIRSPAACEVCGRVIQWSTDMARHKLRHSGNKKAKMHRCRFIGCDYETLQSYNLHEHRRTHTRERPLKCHIPGCKFKTAYAKSLSRHCQKKHPNAPNENSESLHEPVDRQSTTREQYRFIPYPQQLSEGSRRSRVEDGRVATTSQPDHALLSSGSGTSTASRATVAENQPSPQPSAEQAGLQTHDAATPTSSKGVFDDLDSMFNEWFPNLGPLDSSPPLPLPSMQRSVADISNIIPTSSSISPALGSVNNSLLPSIYLSSVSCDASVNSGPSFALPPVQRPAVNTNPLPHPSISLVSSTMNNSLLPLPPVRSFGISGVPKHTPSLCPSYELQYSASRQPEPTQASWTLPAYEAQYQLSIYGYPGSTTAESLPATQSTFSRPSLFVAPDMGMAQSQATRPRAFVGIDQRYLGQSHIYATNPATAAAAANATTYGGASTSSGSGMRGFYKW